MPYQAIKFTFIDLDDNWTQSVNAPPVELQYTATADKARIRVVKTGPDDKETTYTYRVNKGGVVYVVFEVVHIPAKYENKKRGEVED